MPRTIKLSEKVSNAIKNDIASGKLKKGEKIPAEPELMSIYNVGRSTIREAIKTLAMAGILKVQQGSGTVVASKVKDEPLSQRLRRADFDEINAVRFLLEKEIVRLACIHHTSTDLAEMRHYLGVRKKAIEAKQQKKCVDADISFHICIAKASGNQVLKELYQNFTAVIRDFFNKRDDDRFGHFGENQTLHEELAMAIGFRDQDLAVRLIESLLNNNY
jgi:DNA-binding FadR family transcriptional regulator